MHWAEHKTFAWGIALIFGEEVARGSDSFVGVDSEPC